MKKCVVCGQSFNGFIDDEVCYSCELNQRQAEIDAERRMLGDIGNSTAEDIEEVLTTLRALAEHFCTKEGAEGNATAHLLYMALNAVRTAQILQQPNLPGYALEKFDSARAHADTAHIWMKKL